MKAVRWDPAKRADAYAYYAELRRERPIIRAKVPTRGTGWIVTRYEDVLRIQKDQRFSTDPRNAAKSPLFGFGGTYAPRLIKLVGASMVSVDDPAHARLRRLVSKVFTPRSVDDMAPWVEALVESMLDDAARLGTVDFMADFALPLPLKVISEMLGIPEAWRLSFHHQVVRLIEVNDRPIQRALRWLPAMPRLLRFFEDLIDLKRREPDDKLISRLIAVEEEGDHLSRDELIGMIFLLLFAGHETSVNLIGNGVMALLDHPDQMGRLRARPEMIDAAVEEFFRFTNPVEHGTPRFALEDVEIAGQRVRKGEMVIGLLAAANRDETVFADPDRFDVARTGNNRHLGLGFGLHYCLGASLSRLETRIAVNTLLRRFPDLALSAPRETIRWRQSSGLRGLVALPLVLGRDRGRDGLPGPTSAAANDDACPEAAGDIRTQAASRGGCPVHGGLKVEGPAMTIAAERSRSASLRRSA